jgi:hypothetical protein
MRTGTLRQHTARIDVFFFSFSPSRGATREGSLLAAELPGVPDRSQQTNPGHNGYGYWTCQDMPDPPATRRASTYGR